MLGQNGVDANGERLDVGQTLDLSTLDSDLLQLDFYGAFTLTILLPLLSPPAHHVVMDFPTPLDVSSPPPSEPTFDYRLDDVSSEYNIEELSSVAAEDEAKADHLESEAEPSEPDLSSEPPQANDFEFDSHLDADLSDLSEDEDVKPATSKVDLSQELVGLIAQTLVFHNKSTVPISTVLSSLSSDRFNEQTIMHTLKEGPFGVVEDPKLKVRHDAFTKSEIHQLINHMWSGRKWKKATSRVVLRSGARSRPRQKCSAGTVCQKGP